MNTFILAGMMSIGIACLSCNTPTSNKTAAEPTLSGAVSVAQHSERKYANFVDPICDRALPEVAKDTAIVEEKVYGFCSKECKDEFVKAMVAQKLR